MSTGATIITFATNERGADAVAVAMMQAVNLDKELSPYFNLPMTSDATVSLFAGIILRQVVGNFNAEFLAMYPTDPQRVAALRGVVANYLARQSGFVLEAGNDVVVLF